MSDKCFFFAGGGTGGHIYPALAVAEQIAKIEPTARISPRTRARRLSRSFLTTGRQFGI